MPDWDVVVGPAIEHELRRHPGARAVYDADPDYRAALSLAADHLEAVADVAETHGWHPLDVQALLRDTITRLVADGTERRRVQPGSLADLWCSCQGAVHNRGERPTCPPSPALPGPR